MTSLIERGQDRSDAPAIAAIRWFWSTAEWRKTSVRSWRWSPNAICCAARPNGKADRRRWSILDEVVDAIGKGDIRRIGGRDDSELRRAVTNNHSLGDQPIHRPADRACRRSAIRRRFWGFVMLGGMSGGGMGFLFRSGRQGTGTATGSAKRWCEIKTEMQTALPFAMDPVVYDFRINDHGSWAELLRDRQRIAVMPDRYYQLVLAEFAAHSRLRDLRPTSAPTANSISRRSCGWPATERSPLLPESCCKAFCPTMNPMNSPVDR